MTSPLPRLRASRHNRRGAALILTLLISIAISAMALGAILMSGAAQETTKFTAQGSRTAVGGQRRPRDHPRFAQPRHLRFAAAVQWLHDHGQRTPRSLDALGGTVPNISRSLYVGRTGGRTGGSATAGQYGSNFASALSVIRDGRGAVAARRLLLTQESWAKFAVAVNNWAGSAAYGCSESITGPFHSNNALKLQSGCTSPKVVFAGPVTVVGSVTNQSSGDYRKGIKVSASAVPWPTPARINLMRQYAQDADAANGDYDLTAPTTGSHTPGLRIEFLTVDVNGNGTIEWNEGFMRVWVAKNTSDSVLAYATGRRWPRVPAGTTYNDDPNMYLAELRCGRQPQRQPGVLLAPRASTTTSPGAASVKRAAVQYVALRRHPGARPAIHGRLAIARGHPQVPAGWRA